MGWLSRTGKANTIRRISFAGHKTTMSFDGYNEEQTYTVYVYITWVLGDSATVYFPPFQEHVTIVLPELIQRKSVERLRFKETSSLKLAANNIQSYYLQLFLRETELRTQRGLDLAPAVPHQN